MSRSLKHLGLLAHHAQGGACFIACAALVFLMVLAGCSTKGGWLEWRADTAWPDGKVTTERLSVAQPDNPAREATFERKADGAAKVAVPPAYKPADPPSPVSKAMGWLVFVGGAAMFLGAVLMAMRVSGWSILARAPKGWGIGLMLGGALVVAVCVAFDNNPMLAGIAAGIGLIVGVIVSFWDNIKQWMEREQAAGEAVTITKTTTTRTGSGLMEIGEKDVVPPSGAQV